MLLARCAFGNTNRASFQLIFVCVFFCFVNATDVPLTERGESEARAAGQALRRGGFEFDVVYASMLKR